MGENILLFLFGLILGLAISAGVYFVINAKRQKKIKSINEQTAILIKEAEVEAAKIIKDANSEARTLITDADKEVKNRRQEIVQLEQKLAQREENIDRRDSSILHREELLEQKSEQNNKRAQELEKKDQELEAKSQAIVDEIARVSRLSQDEAKKELFKIIEGNMTLEIAAFLKNKEDELNSKSKEMAQNIIGIAIQKYAQDVATERTVSTVSLPSDELKGRIIGREGRNVKTIEQLTGVDLIIDDTPEIITVSCFDPIRREVARRALETLIKDGRIQPGRIEEIVEKTRNELHETIIKAGEAAIFELGIVKINKELVELLGRLQFRTSYGQNVLNHAKEVAHFAGIMAVELGLNQALARRAGLLHDIGKAMDFEIEGSHDEIGARFAKKYQEHPVVINAIESHHGLVPASNVISVLVAAADALSSARPGARSDSLENYIQRVERLEEIAKGFDGVSNAYAIQAGREIRVMVMPEKVDDIKIIKIAADIKNKVETELTYPGQIKVTVIREVRANDVAK